MVEYFTTSAPEFNCFRGGDCLVYKPARQIGVMLRSLLNRRYRLEIKLGRKLVKEKFTWQKVAAQMRALYEDILSG